LSALLVQGPAEHFSEAAVASPPSTEPYMGQAPVHVKKKISSLLCDYTLLLGAAAQHRGYIEARTGRVKLLSKKTILLTGAGALRWFVTVSL
jgi:hypothetical protein